MTLSRASSSPTRSSSPGPAEDSTPHVVVIARPGVDAERRLDQRGASLTAAGRDTGIEVVRVDLDDEMRAPLVAAESCQFG